MKYIYIVISLMVGGETSASVLNVKLSTQYLFSEAHPGLQSLTLSQSYRGYCKAYECEAGEISIGLPDWVAHKKLFSDNSNSESQLFARLDTQPRVLTMTHSETNESFELVMRLQLIGIELHRLKDELGQNIVSRWFTSGIQGECHEVLDVNAEPYWRRIVWLYSQGESTCYQSMTKNSRYDSFFEYTNLTLGYSLSPLYLDEAIPSGEYWGETTYSLGSDADIDLAAHWYSHREIRLRILTTVLPKDEFEIAIKKP